jgi:hypothetical protein
LGLIFKFNLDKKPKNIKVCEELSSYDWFDLSDVKELDMIGPDSPTGALGQLEKSSLSN